MYILELTSCVPMANQSGIGIFEYDQAKALRKAGHKVVFVGIDMRSIRRKRKLGRSVFDDGEFVAINQACPVGAVNYKTVNFFAWHTFKKCYKYVVENYGKPDIIHAHFGRLAGVIALKAKREYGIDYVVTEHNSYVSLDKVCQGEKKLLKQVYSQAKKCIAVSEPFRQFLTATYCDNFVCVPNIVDDVFKKPVNFDEKRTTVVSVGNLIERKGMDLLIDAFADAKSEKNDLKLVIIGDGPQKSELIGKISEYGIDDSVTIAGRKRREDLPGYFKSSICFALASKHETFGVVYIEALSCGLPVIATRCGAPESFIDSSDGILTDVGDRKQLKDAILFMAENYNSYDSSEIKKKCEERFGSENVARKIEKVLEMER